MRANELELLSAAGVEPCFLMDTGGETGRIPFSEAALALRPGMNLLDNWYFADPVNQRGMTEYSGGGYTIDRWRSYNLMPTAILTNQGIALSKGDWGQALLTDTLMPGTYTISILTATNKLGYASAALGADAQTIAVNIGTNLKLTFVYKWQANLSLFYVTNLESTTSEAIVAVKLELGPVQTLAHKEGDTWVLNDPPPNKALELLKCRRYFVPGSSEQLLGAKAVGSMLIVYVPCVLRANPTVIPHKNGELQVFMADGWKTCKYYGINILPTQCGIRYNPPDGVSLQEGTVYLTRYIPSLSCDL